MNVETLQLTVNSKGAQADLGALSRALEGAGKSFEAMQGKFVTGATKTDAALGKAMGQAEKMAKVAALLGKVRIDGSAANALTQFAGALDALGRARSFNEQKLKSLQDFVKLLPSVKVPTGASRMAEFLNVIGSARAPSAATVRNLQAFMKLMANYKGTGATRGTQQLGAFLTAVSQAKAPSQATIQRLELFLKTLASARPIPNARKIADDLLYVAQAAQRATVAFAGLPRSMGQLAGPANQAARAAAQLRANAAQGSGSIKNLGGSIAAARGHVQGMHMDLGGLNDRFQVGYQLGTLFTSMFASFTIGQFVKGVYDANIEIQKLGKAMLFTTGTFDGAQKATGDYLGMAYKMGLSIDKTVESYGRFMISAKASGVDMGVAKKAFTDVTMALQVVGASTEQTQYAFYGLTQMMQKGKVMSEELNRQIGEQIPGSAVAAAGALSKMLGRVVSVGEAFKLIQNGGVMSDKFVPLYGEELRKMYEPLMAMAQKRPDLALNRLVDSFKIFAIIVGQNGFMAQAGKGFDSLAGSIVKLDDKGQLLMGPNGFPMLTEGASKLANTIGTNLAKAVHTALDFIKMLLDHIPQVVNAVKIMIALKVAGTMLEWSNAAGQAASSFLGMGRNARMAAAQVASLQAIQAAVTGAPLAGMSRKAAAAQAGPSLMTDLAAAAGTPGAVQAVRAEAGFVPYAGPGQVGRAVPTTASFGRKGVGAVETITTFDATVNKVGTLEKVAKGAGTAAKELAAPLGMVETAALSSGKSLGSMFAQLGAGAGKFGLIGAAVLAAGAALYGYSQITTSVGGVAVKNVDVMKAGFSVLGDQIGKWWKDSGSKIKLFGVSFDDLGKNSGEVTATIMAGFVYMVDGIADVLKALGEAIQGIIVGPFESLLSIFDKLIHGDFKGALKETFSPPDMGWVKRAGADLMAIDKLSYSDIRKDIVKKAQQNSTAGKAAGTGPASFGSEVDANARKVMEAQIKASNDALAASRKTAADQNAARMAKYGVLGEPLKFDDILKGFHAAAAIGETNAAKAAAAGTTAAQRQIETARASANIGIQGAKDAAKITVDAAAQASGGASSSASSPLLANGANGAQAATAIIKQHEGYRSSAYYDVNHYRVGFGSDTTTDASGKVHNVTKGTSGVSQADAWRDLARRVDLLQSNLKGQIGDAWTKMGAGTQAAITSVAYNYGRIPAGVLAASKTGDVNKIADSITALGGDNKGINRQRRMEEALFAKGQVGGAAAAPGAEIAGMGQQQIDDATVAKEQEKLDNFRSAFASMLTKVDPAAGADLEYQAGLAKLDELRKMVLDYNTKGGQGVAGFDDARLNRYNDLLKEETEDKKNPLGKANREDNQGLDLEALKSKGLEDEAGWQSKLNKLNEDHFIYDQKILDIEKQKFLIGEQRRRQLQAQNGLIEAQVSAEIAALARTGSAKDVALANLLNENYKGGDLASKKSRAAADGTLGTFQQTVAVGDASRRADALKASFGQLQEMAETARMNPTAKALHDDYKDYLSKISGESADSLSELVAKTSSADQKIASDLALAKQKLENPPGFQKWADAVEPLSKKMEDIKGAFMDGLSEGITNALSGDKTDWKSTFHNISKQMIKAQVDTFLSGTIKKFTGGATATPEQTQLSAATTQTTAATTFAQAVDVFANAVGAAGSAAQAANATTASAGLGGGLGAPLAGGLTGVPGMPQVTMPASLQALAGTPSTALPSVNALGPLLGGSVANDNWISGIDVPGQRPASLPMSDVLNDPALAALAGTPSTDLPSINALGPLLGGSVAAKAAAGTSGTGGFMSMTGLGGGLLLPMALSWLTRPKTPDVVPVDPLNGVIGTASDNNVSGTQVAGHSNMIGDLLSIGANFATGGFGAHGPAGMSGSSFSKAFTNIGANLGSSASSIMKLFGGFSEGGISTNPVHRLMSSASFHDAPRYHEGTQNTSGEIPAVLHPNEAVIPLSRGRSIPVEMNGESGGHQVTVNSPIYITSPDANSFRQSQAALQSNQNRTIRRATTRNLSKAA